MQIVMRQISGLGNQLFQYAAARYYANRYHATLSLATDLPRNRFSHGYARPFLLGNFCINLPMHPLNLVERLLLSSRPSLRPAAAVVQSALGIQHYTEPIPLRYTLIDPLPLQPNIRTLFLAGYWQTWQIPHRLEPELRTELSFRYPPTGKNLEAMEAIAACESGVSLHIRRGDYTLAAEGKIALPILYYTRAIHYFQQRLTNPRFFVFSDDIPWAKANLPATLPATFFDHNGDTASHEDLRLMSKCHHHIIANSSFSWWGAWLNPNPAKMVFAPKFWHLHPGSYYPELLPPNWIADGFGVE
jgi:hypothetical protein